MEDVRLCEVSRSIPTQLKNEAVDDNGVTAKSAKEKMSEDQYWIL